MRNSFKLHAGWLIDGSGGRIQKNVILHIANGKIASLLNPDRDDPQKSDHLNLADCTILPGLVDSHVHLFMSGRADRKTRESQLNASFEEIKPVISAHTRQHLKYGITSLRDGGDRMAHTFRYQRECLDFNKTPIHLKLAGRAWHKPNRYGRLIGRTPVENETLAEAIATETDTIDHVKVINSGLNSLLRFGIQTNPQFTLREMKDAVAAAGGRGLAVMVHANGKIPVEIALEAGCRSIEHGFFMGKENLKKMADKQIFWIPTAFTMKAYSDHLKNSGTDTDIPRRNLDDQTEQMAAAKAFGVPVAVGTDAGSLGVHHGSGIVEELRVFMTAGFSIQEAIRCATHTGAQLLGLKDLGLLKPGAAATFIAAEGDPSHLPESLNCINAIFVNGNTYFGQKARSA